MNGKRKKLTMSFLLLVCLDGNAFVVKTLGFSDCSNLSVHVYSRLVNVQKFIILILFIISRSGNNH
jgi:hypothetical protein